MHWLHICKLSPQSAGIKTWLFVRRKMNVEICAHPHDAGYQLLYEISKQQESFDELIRIMAVGPKTE